ncbi:MAG: CDP-diacylglycerol--serine O-phosphatidyltransferase [Desulfobacterales bacterium]|nr:CDP-diacylglycerol--serine O-phosphatidyltransferase [Desulfobacterales bacterium]
MKETSRERLRKGIYLLPNAFTSMNMFWGFVAIVKSLDGQFEFAAISILIAMVFDSLDGKIARATNTTSQFGIEYDSLADLVSFGMAPSLMMYLWVLKPMGRIGWLAAFLFTICGALRLARFNTMAESTPSNHFLGLPIPAAAAMNATAVMFCTKFGVPASKWPLLFLVGMYGLSFLMVSSVKYESFKKAEPFKKMKFNVLVSAILIFVFIAQKPHLALFAIMLAYTLSGPVLTFSLARKERRSKALNT